MTRAIMVVALLFCSVTTAMADDTSKGSAYTGSIATSVASLNNDGNFTAATGSFTTSIDRFNFQAGGMAAKYNANDIWSFGLRAFWRDPNTALLGVVGSTTDVSANKTYRYGIEGEYYLNSLTFAATVGRQNGGARRSEWAGVDIRWYPVDDLMLAVGGSAISDERAVRLGFEWQAPFKSATSVSLFGGVGAGTHGYSHVGAGIRIYFGGRNKSLKRRHREDGVRSVPVIGLSGNTSSSSGSGGGGGGGACPPSCGPPPAGI